MFSPVLSSHVTKVMDTSLTSLSRDKTIVQTTNNAINQYKFSKYVKTMSESCIDTARDQIISKEAKDSLNRYSGWKVTV